MADTEDLPREYFMECQSCGGELFRRSEPMFHEDEEEACPECGVLHVIHIDEGDGDDDGHAYAHTDEHAKDVGQPHCLNECEMIHPSKQCMDEFYDKPCRWNCEKTKAWIAAGGKLPVVPNG